MLMVMPAEWRDKMHFMSAVENVGTHEASTAVVPSRTSAEIIQQTSEAVLRSRHPRAATMMVYNHNGQNQQKRRNDSSIDFEAEKTTKKESSFEMENPAKKVVDNSKGFSKTKGFSMGEAQNGGGNKEEKVEEGKKGGHRIVNFDYNLTTVAKKKQGKLGGGGGGHEIVAGNNSSEQQV
jgi:hypothetical protein